MRSLVGQQDEKNNDLVVLLEPLSFASASGKSYQAKMDNANQINSSQG